MNKSTELCLHIYKKRQIYSVAKTKASFSKFTVVFGNCNRLLFYGRSLFAAPERLMSQ